MKIDQHPVLQLDNVVHQRVRLGILAILNEVKRADFATVRSTLELTPGNLSRHLGVLDDAGLITLAKSHKNRRPQTWLAITPAGRQAFVDEINALRELISRSGTAPADS